jgi:hypothetical protein
MANTYSIVRTDNLAGTVDGSKLVSLKYLPSDVATAIQNGNVVTLSSLVSGEREIWKAVDIAVDTAIGNIVLVASPEVLVDERLKNLSDFRNEAGDRVRGYVLQKGDTFGITSGALTGNLTVGNIIEAAAGTKLKSVATLTSGSTKVGTIIAVESDNTYTYAVIRVV